MPIAAPLSWKRGGESVSWCLRKWMTEPPAHTTENISFKRGQPVPESSWTAKQAKSNEPVLGSEATENDQKYPDKDGDSIYEPIDPIKSTIYIRRKWQPWLSWILQYLFRIRIHYLHQLFRVGVHVPGGYAGKGRGGECLRPMGKWAARRLRKLRHQAAGHTGKVLFPYIK